MALTAEIRAKLSFNQTNPLDEGTARFQDAIEAVISIGSGTGVDQADILWTDERAIGASGTDDIDLAGVLTDAFGSTITAAELVALLIIADAGNTNNLIVGLGANPFLGFLQGTTPAIKGLGPDSVLLMVAPGAAGLGTITAATADILRITNSGAGTSVTYRIAILARTA